jgi:predicted nuclease of predicted toxin-antitoxin system
MKLLFDKNLSPKLPNRLSDFSQTRFTFEMWE